MSIFLGNTKIAGGTGYHPNIFDVKWSDHIINDIQWLRADTFSWQSGLVYKTAYNHLASDVSGKTLQSETISSITIQYYLADDGHKICPASQESNVLSLYNTYGIAWYYILDTTNTQFKLPRTKYGFEGLRDSVGNKIDESLPNITGTIKTGLANPIRVTGTGCFTDYASSTEVGEHGSTTVTVSTNYEEKFDASLSSSTYQNNAKVQERATQMYLYFYVGEYTQTAIEQTAGITSEQLNAKMDNNLANTNALTNCILEDPQNINLTLSNGTLTLKAGSIVCVPNGFEADGITPKFDDYTTLIDTTWTLNSNNVFMFLNTDKTQNVIIRDYAFSGTTAPTSFQGGLYALWYDTTNNLVKFTSDAGVTWSSGCSLPAYLANTDNSYLPFQSIGYISSTVFVRKGLKVLIPNGRNDDGSLKNVEYTTSKVTTFTYSYGFNIINDKIFLANECTINRLQGEYVFVVRNYSDLSTKTGSNQYRRAYVESDNLWYFTSDTGSNWSVSKTCQIADTETSINTITRFIPYTATNILKYSDKAQICGWALPSSRYIDLTLGASGSSYTAPANGWVVFDGQTTASNGYIILGGNAAKASSYCSNPSSNSYVSCTMPYKKNETFLVYYASYTKTRFRFYYAEGET